MKIITKDEYIFLASLFISCVLLYSVEITYSYGLWGSLIVLIGSSIYYSRTFFKAENPFNKLYYFFCILPFIIGYFAVVYKAFGIVDSSTNELIKPDWLNAFYFSVVTWTTLGYGDFRPSEELKVWVMVEALLGYIFMGLLIGKVLFLASKKSK